MPVFKLILVLVPDPACLRLTGPTEGPAKNKKEKEKLPSTDNLFVYLLIFFETTMYTTFFCCNLLQPTHVESLKGKKRLR